ncbi:MAG: sigma 54-interacting transcriptional regulator, partial [Myxococcota bacterium]
MDAVQTPDARISEVNFERTLRERDLYLRLLELGQQENVEPFLSDALRLIVDLVDAERGYIALGIPGDDLTKEHRWSLAHCCTEDQVADIRQKISNSIIAEAIGTGRTIHTPSAVLDPAFRQNRSVRVNRIEEVLCAPVGKPFCVGVVYLQGRVGGGGFPEDAQHIAELFATHLEPMVDRVLSRKLRRDENDPTQALRQKLKVDGLVGRSEALAQVLHEIQVVGPKNINVLITGESGTGKSATARAIHDNSARAESGRFVQLNCAELSDELFRLEMFGSVEGAFTDAVNRKGKVHAAEGGTLFLDEVATLTPASQAGLLHFIQHREYSVVGSNQTQTADVRIISATNVDLQQAMEERQFREDLYYRLVGMPIHMPSLAERLEDLPELLEHFCRHHCERESIRPIMPSPNAYHAVEMEEWRGNVRELSMVVSRAVIWADAENASNI